MISLNSKNILRALNYLLIRYCFKKKLLISYSSFLNAYLKCYVEDVLGRHLYKYGIHEGENSKFLLGNLKLNEKDIAIDIGANLGWYSVLLNRVSKYGSSIFAFEPDPNNFDLLEFNLAKNNCSNVHAFNKAVSDKNQTLSLYKYPEKNLGRHTLLPQEDAEKIDVSTVCLDDFLDAERHSKVKFIKIDIEGYEFYALRGATKILENCSIVMMEFSPDLYPEASHASELVHFMGNLGFVPNLLRQGNLVEIDLDSLICETRQLDVFWIKRLS